MLIRRSSWQSWLPRLLLGFALGVAALLLALVLFAPLLNPSPEGSGVEQMLALFAQDAAVRRTAVASALGLAVTAWIFFRPQGRRRPPPPRRRRRERQAFRPPSRIAGA